MEDSMKTRKLNAKTMMMMSPTSSSSLSTSTDIISSSSVSLAPFVNVCRSDASKRKTFPKLQNFVTSPYLQSPILPKINSKNPSRKKKPKAISKPLLRQKRSSNNVTISKPLNSNSPLCNITLRFLGWRPASCSSGLTHQMTLFQQHCGGNPVIVYRGRLQQGDDFSFTSRRRHGFPFSITIYVDSLLDLKVSVCCEYKHRQGCVLGGSKGHFTLVSVEGSSPCYRCQLMKSQFFDRKRDRIEREQRLSAADLSLESDVLETSPTNDYEDDFEDDEEKAEERYAKEFGDRLKMSTCDSTVNDRHSLEIATEDVIENCDVPISEFENSEIYVNADERQPDVTDLNGYDDDEEENQSDEEKVENEPVKTEDDNCAVVPTAFETVELNIDGSETIANTSSPANSCSPASVNGSISDDNQRSDANSLTSNDDAETSLTSPSDDSDGDVICPDYNVNGVDIVDDKHLKIPSGSDWVVVVDDDGMGHDHAIKQWTDYRDCCHQQFDSSDEGEDSGAPIPPPLVTILADVHAIESPRKENH